MNLIPVAHAAVSNWEAAGCSKDGIATINGITCVIENLLSPVPSLIALAAVFMIILSGIRIVMAGDNPKALAAAWSTFAWAVGGLILLAVAWLIIVAIENFTGAPVTQFKFL